MSKLIIFAKAIPPGARWITVKPHGADSKGQPVLIEPQADGSARVIGGAGGSLNFLKLRAVRSESDYKQEVASKREADKAARAEQRKADKEAGIHESKQKARQEVARQKREHEQGFIRKVADAMGWNPDDLEVPGSQLDGLSEAARNKVIAKHHARILKRAQEAVETQRRNLVDSVSARATANIGEIPLDTPDPEQLSVQDLDPIAAEGSGLGFAPDYKDRAEQAGLTAEELKAEAQAVKDASMTPEQRAAAIKRGESANLIRQELSNIREPAVSGLDVKLAESSKAVELLKEQKKLKQIYKQVQAANKEIEQSKTEPKAYVIEHTAEPGGEDVASDIENDIRTIKTRAFLSEFNRLAGENPTETLGKHIGIGAYNSINSLALAVGGDALVDRSVVDVLGVAGAAQVLARRLHKDFADQIDDITDGVETFHKDHYLDASEKALSQANTLLENAKQIDIGELHTADDLKSAQDLNRVRRQAVVGAQKILGQTLGEMEANAALVFALRQGAKDQFEVSLGKQTLESAIQQARAIGLQRGDYTLSDVAGERFLTINGAGLDRLSKPVNRQDIEQVKRNLAIVNGDHDQDGWLPLGVANRPDLAMELKPGIAARLAEPFSVPEVAGVDAMADSIRSYIGGRAADGDTPGDIYADLLSLDMMQKVGDRRDDYMQALDKVVPARDAKGKLIRAESRDGAFNELADQFVQSRYGEQRSTVNKQKFEVNQKSVDALHRALSEHPEGIAAYKQIGELTGDDQRTLRNYFYRNVAHESPEQAALRAELENHAANEPERQTTDMFGDTVDNPAHGDWRSRRDELTSQVNAASLNWAKYIQTMGGNEKAYESIQDMIKSNVSRNFAETYNKLVPDNPLKIGKTTIRNNLNHLDATDPAAREARIAKERALVDSLRERVAGRYASGAVSDKLDAARDQRAAFEQAQMGFFADEPADEPGAVNLQADERHSIGHAAERQIASMMSVVGKNFKPGQPTKLWNPSMSGGKNAARQRLVKLVDANKRVVAAFGTGSGKSLLQLASFTHLKEQGKAKRGIALVPSIVQGQFNGEALRYIEPGKYNFHIQPGAGRDERIAAYKNPEHDFCVMTHQSFRDDMLYLGAQHAGVSNEEMSNRLAAMSDDERAGWMKSVMGREGINFDYLTIDESQNVLNRAGKENSSLANVVDAMSRHTPYYLMASGDPVKNDASEVYDLMRKMDPARYNDRAAFMRRYGADTLASKDALKREMARYVYPSKIDPDVQADRKQIDVALTDGQKKALAELDQHMSSARLAEMQGQVNVEAMRAISPSSFADAPEDQHEAIAKGLQKNIGILKSSAIRRVINTHAENAKIDRLSQIAHERRGKPGVVFAHNLETVKMMAERLEKEGHRVITLTGADGPQEKDRKRLQFNPESGEASADILIASDAGATGMNIQRGQWMVQVDTPDTAMTHGQRNGRIFRTGQKNNVELMDLVADHPEERRARERLSTKYGLREMMTSPMEGLDDTGVAGYIKAVQSRKNDTQAGLF